VISFALVDSESQQLAGVPAGDGGDGGLIELRDRGDVADRILDASNSELGTEA